MSVLIRYTPVSLTAEKYDSVSDQIEAGPNWPPDGLQIHVCFGRDGDLRVSEIWESLALWQAFGKELMPVLDEAGVTFSGEPEVLEIHNIERFDALP